MKFIFNFFTYVLFLVLGTIPSVAQICKYSVNVKDLFARDPFIYPDPVSHKYYMALNDNMKIGMYESPDLVNWRRVRTAFIAPQDYWGTNRFWAPDLFLYKGKYYMFVTFGNDEFNMEGTSILVSDKIDGVYESMKNGPITPANWQCLDGTLYIDEDKQPWVVFCRAWTEVIDGEIYAQKLSDDLTTTIGNPILLFKASSAPWVGPIYSETKKVTGNVTDAPILYRAKNGELLMLWSSFTKPPTRYAIGVARSSNGKITGLWTQDPTPLNNEPGGGGHAMIFKDFDNQLRISYHSPNSGATRPKFLYLEDNNGKLTIRNEPL